MYSTVYQHQCAAQYYSNTHIYKFFSVSDEQVAQDASFVEVPQADHVLHTVDGGGMHWLDVGGILGGYPVLLQGEGEGRVRGGVQISHFNSDNQMKWLKVKHSAPHGKYCRGDVRQSGMLQTT